MRPPTAWAPQFAWAKGQTGRIVSLKSFYSMFVGYNPVKILEQFLKWTLHIWIYSTTYFGMSRQKPKSTQDVFVEVRMIKEYLHYSDSYCAKGAFKQVLISFDLNSPLY